MIQPKQNKVSEDDSQKSAAEATGERMQAQKSTVDLRGNKNRRSKTVVSKRGARSAKAKDEDEFGDLGLSGASYQPVFD